ncbi:PREDICTED: probable F-box protein At4g22165 [Camelina sativa]|uniref:Probable F-box protein At4g22165 n=1 Tax=Camelina sativa TaxID=90675 RepID=A0ABM0V5V8_CAMSA|nr:PREDICTED: probable F-box protein At4g22165 [Camelina sativa]
MYLFFKRVKFVKSFFPPLSALSWRRTLYPNTWSELPLDLLNLVLERLGFADFKRAKSVCSSWYSTSTVTKNQVPLLILFPKDKNNNNSCTLFNPEEKDRLYKTQNLGVEFAKSVCIATYGSWLLMQDPLYNLYILNLFTGERINLPPVESQLGMVKVERTMDDWFHVSQDMITSTSKGMNIGSPVFWINEETKDYIVLWVLEILCVVYAKKGDTSWNQIPNISDYDCDMLYKDHKLFILSDTGTFEILDFSGVMMGNDKTFKQVSLCMDEPWCGTETTKLVATVTRKVLKVEKLWIPSSRTWAFRVFKIFSSGKIKKCKKVDSLGDEAMLLDLGITVPANDIEGFYKNSIYFSGSHEENPTDIFHFNLETQKMELLHKFDCSPAQLSSARWFLPSLTHT